MVKLIKKSRKKKCSIGIFLNDACDKLTWTNNIGVYTKNDFSQIDLKLIDLRSGVNNIFMLSS